MKHALLSLALSPILVFQGRWVRRHTPLLPEPPGARSGVTGDGPRIRLLVTGDSAAAGVGAPHQRDGLVGRLVRELAPRNRVHWTLFAATGATTTTLLRDLPRLEGRRFDVILTSLGVNDVTAGRSLSGWRKRQRELRTALTEAFGTRLLIVSGLPPVDLFPALPQPLRWYLGRRARQFDEDLRNEVAEEKETAFLSLRFSKNPHSMAPDGFHPGPEIYAAWAERAANIIRAAPIGERLGG